MENSILQRSDEWHEQRKGKFTASEIYKLMGIKALGETGKGYAFDKAIEELYGETEETFVSYDMQRGIELEPLAFSKFQELKDPEFLQVETCGFFNFGEDAGSSPDGLVGEDAILEIKCPKPSTFFKLVATNEIKDQYLYQMQLQMMATNRNKAHFFNYCIIDGIEYWHEIIVTKDDVICDKMEARIKEASELKQEYINNLNNNKQWL
jgi:exodeoxyribonuclease (lambda-induced)